MKPEEPLHTLFFSVVRSFVKKQYNFWIFPCQVLQVIKKRIAVCRLVRPEQLRAVFRKRTKPHNISVGACCENNRLAPCYDPYRAQLDIICEYAFIFYDYFPVPRFARQVRLGFFKNACLSSSFENAYRGLGLTLLIPHDCIMRMVWRTL